MSAWQRFWETVGDEFGGSADAAVAAKVAVRLLTAAVLGGLVGWERERSGKAAGLRTHMLVALGSALFVLSPELAGAGPDTVSRVIQGLAAGIGFLGAGTILKHADHERIEGLTTAAGIWMTAAVGAAAGLGRPVTATAAAGLGLLILIYIKPHTHRPPAGSGTDVR
jgi:putative Mg2+ transporter-C (MgtC) family protein